MRLLFSYKLIPFFILLLVAACSPRNYNVDMQPKPVAKTDPKKGAVPASAAKQDSLLKSTPQDSAKAPSLENAPDAATAGAGATVDEGKKEKKKNKKIFLGHRLKK